MSSQDFLHRDMKSANILLDIDCFAPIGDFRMSQWRNRTDGQLTEGVETTQWMAPEVLMNHTYDKKTNVSSYGMVLWEMLLRDVPFCGIKSVQIAVAVVQDAVQPLMPQDAPLKLVKLIERCWTQNRSGQPDANAISRH
jgi:serine/threonine protein kinase